jgi:hypothetical protein
MCVVAERSVIWLIVCSYGWFCWFAAEGLWPSSSEAVGPRGSAHKESSVKPGCKASGGEIRSENVDMSSDKEGERPSRRKSKGSCLKLI